jgi:hypothetical protein
MALMGGADVDAWLPDAVEVFRENALSVLGGRGGYILGSSSGLSGNTPAESFRALYGVADHRLSEEER